jgi:hypothetical protein
MGEIPSLVRSRYSRNTSRMLYFARLKEICYAAESYQT